MTDKLTLTRAVEVAFQLESAAALASQLAPSSSSFPHRPMLLTQTVALPMEPPGECCTVELDGVCLPLLLDTGASKSLLNVSTVRRLFPLRTLTADAEDLYGYGHSKIGMAGTITFAVRYGTKALPAFTFQVSHQGANLMGFDLFCELGFTLVDNSGAAILSVGSPWHQRWPALFSGLGCLTAFDHQPLLKPENVVADLLSRATPPQRTARARTQPSQSSYSCSMPRFRPRFPWRTFGSRRRRTPLSLLRTYIREGWPARFPEELASFHRLPLDRLRAPAAVTPTAAPCQSARVAEAQRRMKQRFDKRRRVRAPPFTAGDWVTIHRPNRDHKLLSFWTAPMKVTAQLGSATFRLADGSRWHASRLRKVAPPPIVDPGPREDGDFAFPDEQFQGPAGFPPEPVEPVVRPEAHPARVRRVQ
ncbi:hypothetical protein F7725_012005 [Dissostichus mawsoni]|uniref:Peptidase A2 domain-containing protein n=1 Tax=Dissostichus mawsoni TaxID=36200 RepID=A0A7J5ZAE9_DISMA|nr:hypothetical protein F7725_012005 [Dissostichus mawsoni]